MNDSAIGIFDSGMGGLTVMRALSERLPHESFLYLSDTARLPYGTKSAETVARYAVQAGAALIQRRLKMLVIACNTASAYALDSLEGAFASLPIIGVIGPGAEAAIAAAPRGPIAVIATGGTVKGDAYRHAIHAQAPHVEVVQQPCPLFVPLAEEGLTQGDIACAVARHYLAPLREARPECLVLGCTHFPVMKQVIAEAIGSDVVLVDSAATVAATVERQLRQSGIQRAQQATAPSHHYLVTDAPDRFARVGEIFLGAPIDPNAVELIDLH